MAERWTKQMLFCRVQNLQNSLHQISFPVKAIDFAQLNCKNPVIEEIPFPSSKIGGIMHRGSKTTTIGVNACHDEEQKNFYGIHEVFHYIWHQDDERSLICGETPRKQDAILEWQANEGAAELLMPHYLFIPELVSGCEMYPIKGLSAITETKNAMKKKYGITDRVLYNRIEDLRYETQQYRNGVSLPSVEILSINQQRARGITVPESYNDIERRLMCAEEFGGIHQFCPLYGQRLFIDCLVGTCQSCEIRRSS